MKLFNNLTIQFFQQVTQIILPLLIIPVLISRINFNNYSNLVFYQSFFNILIFVVNYGTELPLTRALIKYKEGVNQEINTISNIIIINALNYIIILIISFLLYFIYKEKINYPFLIINLSLSLLIEVFSPVIFLQVFNYRILLFFIFLFSKFILFLLVFTLTSSNFYLYPFFKFISDLILILFSFYFIKKDIKLRFTSIYELYFNYKNYFLFFISRISSIFL
jgi:PST family polysaccharide transporter